MLAFETSKLFHSLTPEELRGLADTVETRHYAPDATIFRAGDPGDGLYLIAEGTVQIAAAVTAEQMKVLTRLGPGDFFGEMAVLDNEPRSATVRAETEVTAFFVPRTALWQMMERSPRLAISMVREFSLRMRDFNRQYLQEVLQAERLSVVGRFARSIVHDFKNPLAIISFAAEMAAATASTPEQRQTAFGRIHRQVDRLSNMINELLEFTRGSQSANVLALTDYGGLVQQIIAEIQPEVAEKPITLCCENPPPAVALLLDPRRLTHVFFNLIHNAVDAMPNGGRITLRFRVDDHEITTEIEDTGPGIAPEVAARLFEPFATHGKAQGTGLGLSICKRIIEDHKGRIHTRTEPGRGAVFSFVLPRPS
jgi:signal transduction histidine kinase